MRTVASITHARAMYPLTTGCNLKCTLEDHANLILSCAKVLYENGQATEEIVSSASQLGRTLGINAKLMPRWGELELQCADQQDRLITQLAADCTAVNM